MKTNLRCIARIFSLLEFIVQLCRRFFGTQPKLRFSQKTRHWYFAFGKLYPSYVFPTIQMVISSMNVKTVEL